MTRAVARGVSNTYWSVMLRRGSRRANGESRWWDMILPFGRIGGHQHRTWQWWLRSHRSSLRARLRCQPSAQFRGEAEDRPGDLGVALELQLLLGEVMVRF